MVDRQREKHWEFARMAEQAERHDDMTREVTAAIDLGASMTAEERNLFSVAYKNVVGMRRSAWRVMKSVEDRKRDNGDTNAADLARNYKERIETELTKLCNEVLELIEKNHYYVGAGGIDTEKSTEEKVFFLKMKGDYCRYKSEIATGPAREEVVYSAREFYQQAMDAANEALEPWDPIRLGLALNFSVFYYEVEGNKTLAIGLADHAFKEGTGDNSEGVPGPDSRLILQLLNDNMTLWKSEEDDQDQ